MSGEGVVVAPWLALFAGVLSLPLLAPRWRWLAVLGFPLGAPWLVWRVPDGVVASAAFLDQTLVVLEGDRLRRLFGTVFTILSFAGGLFALGWWSWRAPSSTRAPRSAWCLPVTSSRCSCFGR
jgi:multicomponent Na+:H+ antiporter subunit D